MKKLLAIVISMAMLVAMMPMGVFAETPGGTGGGEASTAVAQIGDQKYKTLAEAVGAENAENNTITLLKSVTEDITVSANKNITIDLNGNSITNTSSDTITVAKGATLTVKGAGTVDNKTHAKAAIFNNGTVTLNGGTYDRTLEKGKAKNDSGGNSFYTILNHGTMTINDGVTIQTAEKNNSLGRYSSLVENGYQNYNSGNERTGYVNGTNLEEPTLTINGGNFFGGLNTVKNDDGAKLIIKNGKFENYYQASVQNHNIAEITGGTFNSVGAEAAVLNCNASCTAAVEKDMHQLTISGGTFTGEIKKTLGEISVTGGTFSDVSALDYLGDDANVTIQLKDSVTLEKPININSGKIILDLSGKSINVTKKEVTENAVTKYHRNGITVSGSADLTITGDGQITGPSDADCKDLDSKALIEVQGTDAKLTVLNGKISAGGVDDCGMYGIYVYDGGNVVLGNTEAGPIIETWFAAIGENNTTSPANITVNNGTYTENAKPADSDWWAYFCAPIYAASSGDITINGGTFNGYYGISTRYKKVEQNITISGGTFNGSKSAIFVDNEDGSETTEARKIVVKGGTFSTDPSAYVASGYYSAKNSDEKYTVYRYIPSTPSTPADNVTNNAADKNTTADLTPAVKDNKAETTVDAKTADKIVDKAVANKSTEVIVDATGNNTVASSEVAIPEKTVKELAEKTDASLVIKTDNGKVDLDKTALEAVAEQAGTTGTIRLVVETVKTDENICHVDLKLITSNGAVKDFRGGNVKVTINLAKELAAKDVVCVYINDNGIYTLVEGVLNADGTYTFTTGHFSEYAVMAKDEADKTMAEQLDTLIKEVNLKVRTSKTAKKNIKAVVSGDVKALTDAGYTVKYKFYRSEKKASKYVSKGEKTADTYINTAGKKGTKYYYKAKAMVYSGDTLVGQTVLKQCKYGVRTWSK